MSNPLLGTLLTMLTYCRPHGSSSDHAFRARYLLSLPGAYADINGNIHVHVGDSRILWSAHTDTVHTRDGMQTVHCDPLTGIVTLSRKARKRSNCLGADDTAGCFILSQMVQRGIPGHYVFHYGEEKSGIGSSAMARSDSAWLAQSFDYAIALDRRGTRDVITHQWIGRCASDLFALSIAEHLNAQTGFQYEACEFGSYTDTMEYEHLIPECCNLSVGYSHEHTRDESLDTGHVFALLEALCALDQSALVTDRTAGDTDDDYRWRWGYDGYRGEYQDGTPTVRSLDGAIDRQYVSLSWDDVDDDELIQLFNRRNADAAEKESTDDDEGEVDEDDDLYLDPAYGKAQRQLQAQLKKGD